MRPLSLLVLFGFLLLANACQKNNDQPDEITCTGDCLFTVQEGHGTIIRMACFNRFGILADDPNTPVQDTIYGIPDEMNASFEVEGKAVQFSGAFRANTLTPDFPDPSIGPGSVYQVVLKEISEQN